MSLIIATGSNLDSPLENLKQAKDVLSAKFELIAAAFIGLRPLIMKISLIFLIKF